MNYNGLDINGQTSSGTGNVVSKIGSPASAPKPNVLTEYGELQAALSLLDETVDQLRTRLQPILGGDRPTTDDDAKFANPVLSPFGDSIHSDTRKVHRTRGALLDLLDRIEL